MRFKYNIDSVLWMNLRYPCLFDGWTYRVRHKHSGSHCFMYVETREDEDLIQVCPLDRIDWRTISTKNAVDNYEVLI